MLTVMAAIVLRLLWTQIGLFYMLHDSLNHFWLNTTSISPLYEIHYRTRYIIDSSINAMAITIRLAATLSHRCSTGHKVPDTMHRLPSGSFRSFPTIETARFWACLDKSIPISSLPCFFLEPLISMTP